MLEPAKMALIVRRRTVADKAPPVIVLFFSILYVIC